MTLINHADFVASIVRRNHQSLTIKQFSVLLSLYLGETPPDFADIAKHLKSSKPAISRAVDRLYKLGFVTRSISKADGRKIVLVRTRAGEKFVQSLAA